MPQNQPNNQKPKAPKTIREILGMGEDQFVEEYLKSEKGPDDVPMMDKPITEYEPKISVFPEVEERTEREQTAKREPEELVQKMDLTGLKEKTSFFKKGYFRYPVIFIFSFLFFYLVLNFGAITSQLRSVVSPPPNNQEAVLGADTDAYDTWVKKYYLYVGDTTVLAANNDFDGDGLSNIDEFHLNTNPLEKDTDGDGYDDGQEVLNGYNPLYGGKLTAKQEEIIRDFINIDEVRSRKDFQGFVRTAWAGGETSSRALSVDDFYIDPSVPGKIEIPKLKVDAPIVWTKDFAYMEDDLKYGVAHHPDTPFPGERGTSSIHGHSSGYPWDGGFKNVFTRLNYLEEGDEVFVTVSGTNGQTRRYRYLVKSKAIYAVDDTRQFSGDGRYLLNLSTSWPIGTARERYVVTTELAGI